MASQATQLAARTQPWNSAASLATVNAKSHNFSTHRRSFFVEKVSSVKPSDFSWRPTPKEVPVSASAK